VQAHYMRQLNFPTPIKTTSILRIVRQKSTSSPIQDLPKTHTYVGARGRGCPKPRGVFFAVCCWRRSWWWSSPRCCGRPIELHLPQIRVPRV